MRVRATRAACVAVVALNALTACSPRIDEANLAERVAESLPNWNNYQEDIKAQVGAAATAQWTGEPVEARADGAEVFVTFRERGEWEQREVGIPVLLRDPLGMTVRNTDASRTAAGRRYRFLLGENWTTSPIPWVELQFPHHEMRIVFPGNGTWTAAQ